MTWPTEEMLAAYVDRSLDAATERQIEAYLESNLDARRHVERLRRIDEMAREAMTGLVKEPTFDALASKIRSTPLTKSAAPETVNIIRPVFGRTTHFRPLALAASMVVLLGAGLVFMQSQQSQTTDLRLAGGPVAQSSALANLLQRGRSGDAVDIALLGEGGAGARASLISTFIDKAGRFCREIEIAPSSDIAQAQAASVACRTATDAWSIEGSVALAAAETSNDPGFVPSGSTADEQLSALLQSLGAGRALSREQEDAALNSGWQ